MILLLDHDANTDDVIANIEHASSHYPGISVRQQVIEGAKYNITEVHLLGPTATAPIQAFEDIAGVRSATRVAVKYRMIGRHDEHLGPEGFTYNGVRFGPAEDATNSASDRFHLFAGLCAVDTKEHVEMVFAALQKHGLTTTRAGAYKPRTSPYDFQGLGAACLPWLFELAGKYGIKVISMEVTSPQQVEEIDAALQKEGNPTGVMLQIGTRNAQNFELLRAVGNQKTYPVLFKRGMGITLEESLNAAEYIAAEGNPNIVFCLRGVKTHLGAPHRNLVDFGHVPVVRRLTRLPVCVDPSHSVGRPGKTPDGIPDVFHALGQGIISGASMGLVDLHPRPEVALCDGPQALTLDQLPWILAYAERMRAAYDEVLALTP